MINDPLHVTDDQTLHVTASPSELEPDPTVRIETVEGTPVVIHGTRHLSRQDRHLLALVIRHLKAEDAELPDLLEGGLS